MKSFGVTSVVLLTLVLASFSAGEAQARKVLQPSELCSDNPPTAIATFEDADLEAAVRIALSISVRDDLTCSLVSGLTAFAAPAQPSALIPVVYGSPRRQDPVDPFESLVGIQNLTSLTRLTINDKLLTDVSPLSALTSLTFLNLHSNWITDLSALRGLTSLEVLIISENSYTDLSPLSGLTNLTLLRLHQYWPDLRHYMDGSDYGPATSITDISALSGLTNLTDLRLHLNSITDISALSGLTSLTDLGLYGNSITDISALSGLTSLTILWIHDNSITDLSALSGLTSLEVLRLNNNSITDLSALSGLTSLTELALDNNRNLRNIQPLLVSRGLGAGDEVDLRFTWVNCSALV